MEAMAPHGRRRSAGVAQQLFESGHRFDFFQAMRLLRLLHPREPVRLRASGDMAFPPSDIVQVKPPTRPGEAPELTAAFLGLGGVQGPLPRPFAQQLRDRTRAGDTGLRDFLDIFHHRLLSLLYQGRVRRRAWLEPGPPDSHAVARYLYAWMGLGTRGTRGRLEVEDRVLLRYAGLLAHRPVSLEALRALLSDALGVGVKPRAPRGAWLKLEDDQRTHVGLTGRNQRLGRGAVLGTRAWLEQAGVELELGPLSWRRYVDLLPGGRGLGTLRSLTRFAIGPSPEVSLVLSVRTSEIPEQPLGASSGSRLGWTSWLSARPGRQGTQAVALSPRHMSATQEGT
ncbi:type VI secretion system baseplate subunit TssG [Hyalangium versicolor]|uniref:type VI secretion system baseplate subunit TssG n=1 Tax=Hyalangium versicolor TaxID=2861190 RepID=UPI001CCC0BC6|nr:type VI secretion system baseplate subunit TssG [Hyalangium versicolor]